MCSKIWVCSEVCAPEHIWESLVILYLEGPPVARIIPDINKDHRSKWEQQRQGWTLAYM